MSDRIKLLEAEVERLQRGDFTEEEFQNLCHSMPQAKMVCFQKGCEEYQKKLFGAGLLSQFADWIEQRMAKVVWRPDGGDEVEMNAEWMVTLFLQEQDDLSAILEKADAVNK